MKKVYGHLRLGPFLFFLILFFCLLNEVVLEYCKKDFFHFSIYFFILLISGWVVLDLVKKSWTALWAYDESGFELLSGKNKGKYFWSDVEKTDVELKFFNKKVYFQTKKGDLVYLSPVITAFYSDVLNDLILNIEKKNRNVSVKEVRSFSETNDEIKEKKRNVGNYGFFIFTIICYVLTIYSMQGLGTIGGSFLIIPFGFMSFIFFVNHLSRLIDHLKPKNRTEKRMLLMSSICVSIPAIF